MDGFFIVHGNGNWALEKMHRDIFLGGHSAAVVFHWSSWRSKKARGQDGGTSVEIVVKVGYHRAERSRSIETPDCRNMNRDSSAFVTSGMSKIAVDKVAKP